MPGAGTRAVVGDRRDDFVGEVAEQRRIAVPRSLDEVIQPDVEAAAVVGVAAREQVHHTDRSPRRSRCACRASRSRARSRPGARRTLPPPRIWISWPSLPDRLDGAVVADRDVQPAVDPGFDAVGRVVGAAKVEAEPEPAHERPPIFGDAVAVRVPQRRHERRMRHVERLAVEHRAARAVERREDGVLVGLPVVVLVHQAQDAAHARIGLQRAVAIDADEDDAFEARGHAGGIVEDRRRREGRGLKTGRHLDIGQHLRRRGRVHRHGPARRKRRHFGPRRCRRRRLLLRQPNGRRKTDDGKNDGNSSSAHMTDIHYWRGLARQGRPVSKIRRGAPPPRLGPAPPSGAGCR